MDAIQWYIQQVKRVIIIDNNNCHVSKSTKNYFDRNGLRLLDWPDNFPDLNPIGEVWNAMKKQACKGASRKSQLFGNVSSTWYNIKIETIMGLYNEMPRRVKAVYDAKGGPTLY